MKFQKISRENFRNVFLLILGLVMIISSILVATAAEKADVKAYVKVKSRLNLRDLPSSEGTIISKLNPGDIVIVDETLENGWSKVSLENGGSGYVSSQYIVIPEKDIQEFELISAAVITSKNSSKNRNFNMAKACEAINGLVLEPGDEFDWYGDGTNGVVGSASQERGYKESNIILDGKYVKGYGGGVCQVSTAVYNCIYKLDIIPTEHYHHSLSSSYVAKGMDATVAFPNKNFVFSNTKDYTIVFEAYTDGGQVIVITYKAIK